MAALDALGLPNNAEFVRQSDHVEFGSKVAMQNSHARAMNELHPLREVPRSTWTGEVAAVRDDRVSIAIYSFPGPPGGNLGLQLTGTARCLDEHESAGKWLRFEVTLLGIWLFDSRADRYRHGVDLDVLQRAMAEESDADAQGSQQ